MLLIAVEVRPSAIHGLGVYACEAVPCGRIVWQFDAGMDRRHPVSWLDGQPEHVRAFIATYGVLSLDKQHVYIAGDHTLFINHSPTPNLAPRDDLLVNGDGVVVAARDIAAGEELTVNYADIDGTDRDKVAQGLPVY
ncbi:MAG: SET domain-containing protein [Alphaproteobacteria bacterium]